MKRGWRARSSDSRPRRRASALAGVCACSVVQTATADVSLERIGRLSIPGAEIVAFDPATRQLFVSGDLGITIADLEQGDPAVVRTINLAEACGFNTPVGASVTHVAVDPLGRGFAAASVIPADRAGLRGQVVFFSTATGEPIRVVWAGFGPDAVAFTSDGSKLLVANEGEPQARRSASGWEIVDPPGSISVVSLEAVRALEDLAALPQESVSTVTLQSEEVRSMVSRAIARGEGLRISPRCAKDPTLDLEPESIAFSGGRAFVTLQENNAIAEFDLRLQRWTRLRALGARTVLIDASDRDGGARIDDLVSAAPCPDQIATVVVHDRAFLVTCDEGDDRDWPGMDPLVDVARVDEVMSAGAGGAAAFEALGRLKVCSFTGDTDGDGRIDRPTALGARSVSVWSADELSLVGETGPQFEQAMRDRVSGRFNADDEGQVDNRSDDRGPEPEGVVIGEHRAAPVAFVSLERPGAVAIVDLSKPASPRLVGLHDSAGEGDFGPEGLAWIKAELSPVGSPLLVVSFEKSGTLSVYRVVSDP